MSCVGYRERKSKDDVRIAPRGLGAGGGEHDCAIGKVSGNLGPGTRARLTQQDAGRTSKSVPERKPSMALMTSGFPHV